MNKRHRVGSSMATRALWVTWLVAQRTTRQASAFTNVHLSHSRQCRPQTMPRRPRSSSMAPPELLVLRPLTIEAFPSRHPLCFFAAPTSVWKIENDHHAARRSQNPWRERQSSRARLGKRILKSRLHESVSIEFSSSSDVPAGPVQPPEAHMGVHDAELISKVPTPNSLASGVKVDGNSNPIPSYKQLLLFLSTTVLIWLSEPLLSLVDTTVVGFASTANSLVQLASLGPATALYDSLLYLCYFLAISTTNQLAPALAVKNYRELQQTTSHLLGVAIVLGMLTTILCFGAGPTLLRHMVSSGPASVELIHYATRYVWIRSSVAVASILGMVMQAFCLATLDTITPAKVVAVASTVNIAGDVLLRKWGVQGAAVATALSSLLSSSVLFGAVRKQTNEWRRLELEQAATAAAAEKEAKRHTTMPVVNQTEFLLASNATVDAPIQRLPTTSQTSLNQDNDAVPSAIPFVSFPDRRSIVELVQVAGPIFFVILAKIMCYSAMTLRCTNFGVLALATHNIMTRIFFFFGTSGDSLSQAAQSFLPATLYPTPSTQNFRAILTRLATIASVLAITNSNSAVLILRTLGRFLARDAGIVRMMADQSLFMGMALFLHPFITLLEGTVIASRDFRSLVATYAVTLGLHFGILRYFSGSFSAIWRTFFLFQSIRLLNFGAQVWRRQVALRKTGGSTVS